MSPASQREHLAAECHAAALEVFAAVNRSAGSELLSLELTMGQFKAMTMVTMYGPQPVGELGRRLGISEPAASLLVDKLADLNLARRERDPLDGRRILVTATPAAVSLAGRLRQGRREQVLRWLGALGDDELAGLLLGLRALAQAAGEDRDADAEGTPASPDATAKAPTRG